MNVEDEDELLLSENREARDVEKLFVVLAEFFQARGL